MSDVFHFYITETAIKHGGMTHSDKYASFTMLCKVDAYAEGQPSEFRKKRNTLSVREHWHGPGGARCETCQFLRVLLRANVKKAERPAFTVAMLQALLRAMEAVQANDERMDREYKQGEYAEQGNQT